MSRIETIAEGIVLHLGDCREILPRLPAHDAVVTDPPYGIGIAKRGTLGTSRLAPVTQYERGDWDNDPITDDLMALVRVSGQFNIIFGGNYYNCAPASCWLVWDKETTGDYADCELAWTNLPKAVRRIRFMWNGMLRKRGEPRGDHPTQKPVGVMKWCIEQLPAGCETILDPFMGSGTTGVAAVQMGKKFTGIERHEKYFDAACRRVAEALRQPDIFIESPKIAAAEQFGLLDSEHR